MKTKTFGWVMGIAAAVAATASQAEGWRFSAGPAWRSRVEVKTSGSATAPLATLGANSVNYRYDTDRAQIVSDPVDPTETLWDVPVTRTEVIQSMGDGMASLSDSDDTSALGLNLSAGYDVYSGDWFSVGLGLRFAAYFDMKSSSSAFLDTGSTRTRVSTGWFLHEDMPYPPSALPAIPDSSTCPTFREDSSSVDPGTPVYGAGSRLVRTRYRADLWQLGVGPNVTWHALSWLDAYAGAEAILNLVAADFDANGSSTSRTDCRLGFGGPVGLEAKLTDCLGLYGQVGYEWVDASDASAGGIDANADFSSLVVSAGVCFRF